MMLLIYNLIQALLSPVIAPVGLLWLMSRAKYRSVLPYRLGKGLKKTTGRPCFWVHALSVGEVNAALPLIQGIRDQWPESSIVCSATTATGLNALRTKASDPADMIIPSPFDILPVIRKFIKVIHPECFILVETDLWPNWLRELKSSGTATVLVNGSISSSAAQRLKKLRPIADLLYGSLDLLCMQSHEDMKRLSELGITRHRLKFLGNLKYDVKVPTVNDADKPGLKTSLGLDATAPLWIAGSTHPGEEESVLMAFKGLIPEIPGLQLLIAPRDPQRGREILSMVSQAGLKARCRTQPSSPERIDVLILDTLGELLRCYALADAAFVGGSLVNTGGHNLLEPAAYGVPVLFGPFVESCMEMARELRNCGGGIQIQSARELQNALNSILLNKTRAQDMSSAAQKLVLNNQGSVSKHIKVLSELVHDRDKK